MTPSATATTTSPIATPIGPMPCEHCINIARQWDVQAEGACRAARVTGMAGGHPVVRQLKNAAYRARSNAQTHRTADHSVLLDRA
jgi:hypothetical protein